MVFISIVIKYLFRIVHQDFKQTSKVFNTTNILPTIQKIQLHQHQKISSKLLKGLIIKTHFN